MQAEDVVEELAIREHYIHLETMCLKLKHLLQNLQKTLFKSIFVVGSTFLDYEQMTIWIVSRPNLQRVNIKQIYQFKYNLYNI